MPSTRSPTTCGAWSTTWRSWCGRGARARRCSGSTTACRSPQRDAGYGGSMVMPDRISIFRRPILAMCADEAEVVQQVRITVIHEVAHHFGIDDARLHELGWA